MKSAAAVAFGVVLALCVLLVLLLMSSAVAPQSGMPLGFTLGIAAVAGLLGGGGFGWALSRRGWVPPPPVPPQRSSAAEGRSCLLLFPGTLERIRDDGFTPFALFVLGLLVVILLTVILGCVFTVMRRKRVRRFLALFGEAGIRG